MLTGPAPPQRGITARGYTVLLAIAVIVVLIGLGVLVTALPPQTRVGTFDITPGANHYVRFQVDLLTAGSLTVNFAVTSGGTVNVWIMTDAQHSAFINAGVLNYLASDSGSSGTFSASLPSGGAYFVETGHGSGYESTDQIGVHTITINAVQSGPVYGAIGTFVVAAILVGIGLWLRSRPEKPRGYSMPPPYVPAGYPRYAGIPPAMGPATPGLPTTPSTPLSGPPATGTGMILVTVENRTGTDQSAQLLVGGVPAVSLTIPAGGTGQAHLRTSAAPAPGSTVRVDIVTASGGRGGQDVVVAADGTAQVNLRIG